MLLTLLVCKITSILIYPVLQLESEETFLGYIDVHD